ncbi:MAG: GNAT family N-acetyltransferase [Ginsengibacter sp.]
MLTIFPVGIEAIPVIRKIAHESWKVAYKDILEPGQMTYMLAKFYDSNELARQHNILKYETVLATDDDVSVGFATYSPKENFTGIFRLHKIYVLPGEQGNGTGRRLMDYVIAEIQNQGANILELNVNRQNKARLFYEKLGFVRVCEEDIPIGNGYFMNDYVMQKVI